MSWKLNVCMKKTLIHTIVKTKLSLLLTFIVISCEEVDNLVVEKSSEAKIISFSLKDIDNKLYEGKIDTINNIINFLIPTNVDLTKLKSEIDISKRASISPISGLINDFSNPVKYIIVAEDGTKSIWTVSIEGIIQKYLCEGKKIFRIGGQFGFILNDNINYCACFDEIGSRVEDGELVLYFLLSDIAEDNCDIGSLHLRTKGFKKLGKSPLKLLSFRDSRNLIRVEDYKSTDPDGIINIISLKNGIASGEFSFEVNWTREKYYVKGNFKDISIYGL